MAKSTMMMGGMSPQKKWVVLLLLVFSVSTVIALFMRASFESCDVRLEVEEERNQLRPETKSIHHNPLAFMRSNPVLLVSHELSPFQVIPANGQEAFDTALKADLVVLNTAVAGKWLDVLPKENIPRILPKILWWIHEMRGQYFQLDYVKHLPFVAGAMIDSHTTAAYWQNRTQDRLRIKMPQTYVVHLGNSKELMEVAEDSVARRVLCDHVRESLGVRSEDLLFAIINSVSRGKGQDLFLRSFYESLKFIQEKKLQVPSMHAVVVGSEMTAQPKIEMELRKFVHERRIQDRVHFVHKTLNVAPYLAAIDVLVQNSQARGECFGRITIEAMAFQLPVLGTAAGGTAELVVNGSTGLLHPVGKEGITPLAKNIVTLATHVECRLTMGRKGYQRVKDRFLEQQMANRIAWVLKEVTQFSKGHTHS